MIGVHAADPRYRVAVAELPSSTHQAVDPRGAITVVVGRERLASAAGAGVVVLADPAPGVSLPRDPSVPIVIDRAWLRADVVVDARSHPDAVLFTVECATPPEGLPAVVRDAVGWLRVLSGDQVELDEVETTERGVIALLRAGGRAATMMVTVLADPSAQPRLRATAIGVERVEVVIGGGDAASVIVSSEAGSASLPARRESRHRLSLRRSLAALDGEAGDDLADLADLAHDDRIASAILRAHNHSLFRP